VLWGLDFHKCLIFYEYKEVKKLVLSENFHEKQGVNCDFWVCSADVWIRELFLFKDLCMQVGAFCDEFSEKG
jgi:hypothetical protein